MTAAVSAAVAMAAANGTPAAVVQTPVAETTFDAAPAAPLPAPDVPVAVSPLVGPAAVAEAVPVATREREPTPRTLRRVPVPDVIGLPEPAARAAFEAAGLTVSAVDRVESDLVQPDHVAAQSAEPGTLVDVGAAIAVAVADPPSIPSPDTADPETSTVVAPPAVGAGPVPVVVSPTLGQPAVSGNTAPATARPAPAPVGKPKPAKSKPESPPKPHGGGKPGR